MNKRPGHVVVTTEVAFCSFCGRPRTLRNEQHQLGTLVRTIVTCETCHRTLSSSIGVAESVEPDEAQEAPAVKTAAVTVKPEAKAAAKPAPPTRPKAKAAASKATPSKSGVRKKAR